jgi:Trk K+ transport system NAD-binding subunit
VLLREFRLPLFIFTLTLLIVAFLFDQFYTHHDYPNGIPFDEALYSAFALTTIEPTPAIPQGDGHWLIVFYFMMPLVGILLASQGLAGFFSLLFNRRARGSAWTEALISTYSKHKIVCGLGHVGSRVVDSLLNAGSEVVGVDHNPDNPLVNRVRAQDVPVLIGDIRNADLLVKAGIKKAKAVIIATNNDMANLEAALQCRELNPEVRIVVRMFDAELARRVKGVFDIDEAFSTSSLAAPIFAGAALDVEVDRTFQVGDDVLSVGRLTVNDKCKLCEFTVGQVENQADCSIILLERKGHRDLHPPDDFPLQAGDMLVVLADFPTLQLLAKWNRP